MKSKAYTLIEAILVIFLMSILVLIFLHNLNANDIKTETLQKMSKTLYIKINFATTQLMMKRTENMSLRRIIDSNGMFSIEDKNNLDRFINIYKMYLIGIRNNSILPSSYTNKTLIDINNQEVPNTSISNFSTYRLKNNSIIGIKLNNNCTTTENYIYDPSNITNKTVNNSCGLLFIDINGIKEPNTLEIDQYLVPFTEHGLK